MEIISKKKLEKQTQLIMGFGLLFFFVFLPLNVILIISWVVSREKIFGQLLLGVWISIFGLLLLGEIAKFFTSKKTVIEKDIYGEYVIDRTKFSGEQADWQYNHFRFEIKQPNLFIFHQTDKHRVLKSDTTIFQLRKRNRLVISTDSTRHHIIYKNPTLYRTVWSFYYVFGSPKFGNVFFTKGKWKAID